MSKKKSLGAKAPSKKSAGKKAKPAKKAKAAKKNIKPAKKRKNQDVDLECFLSTACMRHRGLNDKCTELIMLRSYRDNYMRNFEQGKQLVEDYYRIAPSIVRSIESDPDKKNVYEYIYSQISHSCSEIIRKRNRSAMEVYKNMVDHLMLRYA